jgi:hypothetical protein
MVLDRLSPLAVVALAHDRVHAGQPPAALCQFAFRLSMSASSRPPVPAVYAERDRLRRSASPPGRLGRQLQADRADGLRPRVAHYFAYAALDDGQKAAIAPLQWTERLKATKEIRPP